jgi:hypothetical protein
MIFLNGNTDLVTRILEFVAESSEELNTCAMISRVFRLSRSDPQFDQTRTGTIIFKTSLENIPPEVWQRWDQQVFTGNRIRLVAILTQLPGPGTMLNTFSALPILGKVSEVILRRDLSKNVLESFAECDYGGERAVTFFRKLLPNLDILDIGALAVTTTDLVGPLNFTGPLFESNISVFRCTAEVGYRGCHHFYLEQPVNSDTISLREIHIDPFGVYFDATSVPITAYCKEYSQLEQEQWFGRASYFNNGADWVLLQEYTNLERVTLKHAEYVERHPYRYWKQLPQEALFKFVRHTPTLRWFCSDLTQENIAILKKERPEVEFCK